MEWETTDPDPCGRKRDKGVTTIEYTIMLILVAIVIAFTVFSKFSK